MTRARRQLVCPELTPYYHVVSRCVRRAFLCGRDEVSGKDYNHRRDWIEQRLRLLGSMFAVDVCAYAVMSNHYHLVIRLNLDEAASWSDKEVAHRWLMLFKGPTIARRFRDGDSLDESESQQMAALIATYRSRLESLSWFMKCLNEPIARQANREDECTGHFWEARFKSQALLDDAALMACMAYVDLNPIRAGIATTPEESRFTSIRERLRASFDAEEAIDQQTALGMPYRFELPVKPLMSFAQASRTQTAILSTPSPSTISLPMTLSEYLTLVDHTGRQVRTDKRSAIPIQLPPIFERLGCKPSHWLDQAMNFEKRHRQQRFAAGGRAA